MTINWEVIENTGARANMPALRRAAIPGGWLLFPYVDGGNEKCLPIFIPDPDHAWGREVEIAEDLKRRGRRFLWTPDGRPRCCEGNAELQCRLPRGHETACDFISIKRSGEAT